MAQGTAAPARDIHRPPLASSLPGLGRGLPWERAGRGRGLCCCPLSAASQGWAAPALIAPAGGCLLSPSSSPGPFPAFVQGREVGAAGKGWRVGKEPLSAALTQLSPQMWENGGFYTARAHHALKQGGQEVSCAGRVMLAWHLSLSLLRFPNSLTKSTKLVEVLKGPWWEQSRCGCAALSCGARMCPHGSAWLWW